MSTPVRASSGPLCVCPPAWLSAQAAPGDAVLTHARWFGVPPGARVVSAWQYRSRMRTVWEQVAETPLMRVEASHAAGYLRPASQVLGPDGTLLAEVIGSARRVLPALVFDGQMLGQRRIDEVPLIHTPRWRGADTSQVLLMAGLGPEGPWVPAEPSPHAGRVGGYLALRASAANEAGQVTFITAVYGPLVAPVRFRPEGVSLREQLFAPAGR